MSITDSNVSNVLCELNINMSDIINGSASNLMKIAFTGFNALPDELWKCDMILELTDCNIVTHIYLNYLFLNCSFSYCCKYYLNYLLKNHLFSLFFMNWNVKLFVV